MTRWRLAAVLGVLLLLTACGDRPQGSSRHPHATPSTRPGPTSRARLRWGAGETFRGLVTFDEQDQGALTDELRFTAHERFRVLRVEGGVATMKAVVTGWHWQRNTSAVLTASLPGPATFAVNSRGEIVSGVDWPLPSQLPAPGLDVFAAPLVRVTGWSRTDGQGIDLAYQAGARSSPGQVVLDWSTVRPRFTRSGDPITVRSRAEVSVSSRYRRRGATVFLRATRERATFETSTQAAAGTTRETGTVLETTVFSLPA
ncbi:MAG: hypothetical protein J2P38_00640 [Candidatus Dormibacteraeota bacterium]|nr:hypothetical protein [Candidatus Dormibacteraeota bacterium]